MDPMTIMAIGSALAPVAKGLLSSATGGSKAPSTSQNVSRSDAQQNGVNVITAFGDFGFSNSGRTVAGPNTVYTSTDPSIPQQRNFMPLAIAAAGGIGLWAMMRGRGRG